MRCRELITERDFFIFRSQDLALRPQFHVMFSDVVDQDGGHASLVERLTLKSKYWNTSIGICRQIYTT